MPTGKKPAADTTPAKGTRKNHAGLWKKGQSGNPGGRPALAGHVRDLARQYTEESVKTLVEIMRDKKAHATSRATAAQSLLDRGWGKPSQPVGGAEDLPPIRGVRELSEVELMALAQQGSSDG